MVEFLNQSGLMPWITWVFVIGVLLTGFNLIIKGLMWLWNYVFHKGVKQEKYNNLEKKVDGLSDKVDHLFTDFSSLKTDFGSLKTDFGSLKTDFGSLKTDFSSLKKTVEYICQSLKITDRIDNIGVSDSPIHLNDRGKAISEAVDAKELAKRFIDDMHTLPDDTSAYDIQEACFGISVDDLDAKLVAEEKVQLKEAAFQKGMNYDSAITVISFELRDIILAERGLGHDTTDAADPKKT